MHGHERPRDKGVNSDASFQPRKPRLVQPASERQKGKKVHASPEHATV